jgi:hypothetical protein
MTERIWDKSLTERDREIGEAMRSIAEFRDHRVRVGGPLSSEGRRGVPLSWLLAPPLWCGRGRTR